MFGLRRNTSALDGLREQWKEKIERMRARGPGNEGNNGGSGIVGKRTDSSRKQKTMEKIATQANRENENLFFGALVAGWGGERGSGIHD